MRLPLNPFRALLAGTHVALITSAAVLCGTTIGATAAADDIVPTNPEAYKYWQLPDSSDREAYREEKMPPGFQVIATELEGPVFADAEGRTLYKWQLKSQRNGSAGDREGNASTCTNEILRVSAGLMSPYPAGLLLPDLDKRRSCVDIWPPVLAPKEAKGVGKWTVIPREDGTDQWAYDKYPVYTSILDRQPGDVWGGSKLNSSNDGGVAREPIGPAPGVPPEFAVVPSTTGRLVTTRSGSSVYTWDGDKSGVSNCQGACLSDWTPVLAPAIVKEQHEWTVVERTPGVRQWAFRGKPLYTYNFDRERRNFRGADVSGWHNVYTQRVLMPPKGFTVQDAEGGGQVLADARGRTIYQYSCKEDTTAQLSCDSPETTQAYRLAICGNGDPALCQETFPYVVASAGAKSASHLWSVMAIDPQTGRRATAGGNEALQVWAYRDRPVYTYVGDREPGVTNGDGYGEFTGRRNGYKAFVLRDVFQSNEFRQ